MSEPKSPQDWTQDWQALQSQYWNAWSDATRGAMGEAPPAQTPWHQGIEQWAQLFGNSGKQSESVDRVLGSARAYVALMQSMFAAVNGKAADGDSLQGWIQSLRNGLNLPGMDAAMQDNPLAAMLSAISGPGAHGFDQLAASFAPMLNQAREEGLSWLRTPTFGYSREQQEQQQQALIAFSDYQKALRQYNALILKSSQRSFEILETKLAERAEPGRQIESMRALYDLWVDAAEEAYAQIASSEEFRKAYGELVDAQTRVRAKLQSQVERVCTDLGMPTRTELNSVHRRLHDLRRGRNDGGATNSGEKDAGEVKKLRAEVEALKQALGNLEYGTETKVQRSASAGASRKTASKRSSAVAAPADKADFHQAIKSMRSRVKGESALTAGSAPKAASVKAAGKPAGKTSGKSASKPVGKTAGKTASKPAGKTASKAVGKRGGKR
ncbi:MAG: class III poly(R)-hydroxyalkanoic acid synthase subunit PhaE [Rudaea sp.]